MTPQTKTGVMLAGVAAVMVSLSFAAVPFYRWFCQTTGFGGATLKADTAPGTILDRTVTVRFDASTQQGMAWTFLPVAREMTLRLGETGLAFYEAYNPTDRVIAGTATFNVTPDAAGGFFTKIDCFCFTEQVLQPGERVQMPVTFFVDPAMVDDPEGTFVKSITLSYTFYETDLPAAALPAATAAVN